MASREGTVVLLEDLIREATRRAQVIVEDKNPELDTAQKQAIASAVGIGAIKYPMLSRDNTKIVTFDWQAALEQAFLHAFISHHEEYDPASCLAVSGSSRTALGLLGFHCGIREVVINLHHLGNRIRETLGSGEAFGLSIAYSENGDLDASAAALRRAITFLEKSDQRRDYCIALNNLAMTLLDQRLLDEALV